jgi:hypothetical protein
MLNSLLYFNECENPVHNLFKVNFNAFIIEFEKHKLQRHYELFV